MKIFVLIALLASISLPCENRPWADKYGEGCQVYKLIVVGVQPGSGGWNEIYPTTYTRLLHPAKMVELRGIWGKPGDTLSVHRDFILKNCSDGMRGCLD
jgi:hypothetical protein